MKKVFLISDIEQFGLFIAYCIELDICVFRTYWNENNKGDRCYCIDFSEKRCYYGSKQYWINEGYEIFIPQFYFNEFGRIKRYDKGKL